MGSGAASKSGGIIIFASPTDGRRFGGDGVCWVLAVDEILEQTGHRQGSSFAKLSWQDQPSWMACGGTGSREGPQGLRGESLQRLASQARDGF